MKTLSFILLLAAVTMTSCMFTEVPGPGKDIFGSQSNSNSTNPYGKIPTYVQWRQ